jgi:glycosyltransferase involved in cell wall biosynthesis
MPRVSVIVPAHNAAAFVGSAIESVRAQTYRDWEIVAVDDGSTDDTWELLRAAGPDVRCLRRETPGGPAAARNLALENARGELVVFLDADDRLLPRYLESQLAYYQVACESPPREVEVACRGSSGEVEVVCGGSPGEVEVACGGLSGEVEVACGSSPGEVGLVSCDARIMMDDDYVSYTHLCCVQDRYAPITLERVLRRNPIYISCLVPVVVGESVGWFDPELFGTEDYGLWIKILEAGYRVVLNEEVLAVYRRTAGTVSSNIASQGRNNQRVYELALARGRLSSKQRRIARRSIRYNRAMEEVALLRFGTARGRAIARALIKLPLLVWVALGNPRLWAQWFELLRTGRAKDAAELRAHP